MNIYEYKTNHVQKTNKTFFCKSMPALAAHTEKFERMSNFCVTLSAEKLFKIF